MTGTGSDARWRLRFVKMEGAGNDYVYVDAVRAPFPLERASEIARVVADRHAGVGGDGLILLAPSTVAGAVCRMLMWNADGSRGGMCGNGLRCVAKLAYDCGLTSERAFAIETDGGVRRVQLSFDACGEVTGARAELGEVRVDVEPRRVQLLGRSWLYHRGDAGNPHAVVFVDVDPEAVPVGELGPLFQRLAEFPDSANVNFVQVLADGSLVQRTYERGSGETMACGSGATTSAACALATGRVPGPRVPVRVRGGCLVIERGDSGLVMEGPARTVFSGEIELAGPSPRR